MYTYMYVCDRETEGTLLERPCQKSLLNNFTDCTFNAELKQCGLLFEMLTDFLHGIQTFTHITMIALLILFNFWHWLNISALRSLGHSYKMAKPKQEQEVSVIPLGNCATHIVLCVLSLISATCPVSTDRCCVMQSNTTPCYPLKPCVRSTQPSHAFGFVYFFIFYWPQNPSSFKWNPPAAAMNCLLATHQSVSDSTCVRLPCAESPDSLQASACCSLAVACFYCTVATLVTAPSSSFPVGTLCPALEIYNDHE